jgi:hypothetical protein
MQSSKRAMKRWASLPGETQIPWTPLTAPLSKLARQGKKVMQFLHRRRYIAVVVESKVQFYGKAALDEFDRKAEITATSRRYTPQL